MSGRRTSIQDVVPTPAAADVGAAAPVPLAAAPPAAAPAPAVRKEPSIWDKRLAGRDTLLEGLVDWPCIAAGALGCAVAPWRSARLCELACSRLDAAEHEQLRLTSDDPPHALDVLKRQEAWSTLFQGVACGGGSLRRSRQDADAFVSSLRAAVRTPIPFSLTPHRTIPLRRAGRLAVHPCWRRRLRHRAVAGLPPLRLDVRARRPRD